MTRRAMTIYGQTHPVDGRAWWGRAEGQTERDMEGPDRGKLHSLNDHRPAIKVDGGAGWRRVRDHRMRMRVLTFTMLRWSGPCRLSTRSRPPKSGLYLTRHTVPLCYMSTMIHEKTVPFALPVTVNGGHGIGLQCQLSAVLPDGFDDEMGLC